MGRKNKKDRSAKEDGTILTSLKKETVEGISAIIFLIIAVFLILARFDKAGFVGEFVYSIFTRLVGVGYYLLPIALIVLGISFLKSLSHNLAWPKITGAIIFLVSGIGLIDLIFGNGGAIGKLISMPLNKLFDFWVSTIILTGGLVISMLVIFDTSLKVSHIAQWLRKEKNEGEEDDSDADVDVKIDTSEEDDSAQKVAPKKAVPESADDADDDKVSIKKSKDKEMEGPKKNSGLVFFSKKTATGAEYKIPPLSLLENDSGKPGTGDIKANANIIKRTLGNFGIHVEMDEVSIGPTVTRYALKPAEGVKLSRIVALQNDLSLALAAHPIRIEAPIPGKSLVGIEIPNTSKTKVGLGTLLKQAEFQESHKPLMIGLGKGVTGHSHFTDLGKAPHMLIAGATGSGKSVTIHTLITSLLFKNSPDLLKFIMIDPKRVELTLYNKIPHLLTPVITDAKKTILSLKWAAKEMDRRYDVLQGYGVRDISSYHAKILTPAMEKAKKEIRIEGEPAPELPETMPFIVIVIDELADIMQTYPRELESGIVRLAQMSRAIGIHLIISTQRPSVNVITGLIKANVPTRVALQVASQIDSRTILDQPGAEKLLGQGDMLFLGGDMAQPRRIQSAFISEDEIKTVVKFLVDQYQNEVPESNIDLEGVNERNNIFDSVGSADEDADDDELYGEAKEVVVGAGKASTSYLQRKLGVGYSRAAKLIDLLEEKGVIGPANGSKPREILVGGGKTSPSESTNDGDEVEMEHTDEESLNR